MPMRTKKEVIFIFTDGFGMILVTIQCCVDVLPFMPLGLRSFNITLTPFSPTWIGDLTRLTPQFYQYQQIYRLLTQSKATDT